MAAIEPDLDVAGLVALISILALPCDCEDGRGGRLECSQVPLRRGWGADVLDAEQRTALAQRSQRTQNGARIALGETVFTSTPGLDRTRPERVPQIVEPDVPDLGALY
jgi:hypothetical protein